MTVILTPQDILDKFLLATAAIISDGIRLQTDNNILVSYSRTIPSFIKIRAGCPRGLTHVT
ncbi:hypothetical protein BDV24DRAFT_120438 [Aspergillus arachidicola]|uniref:Uncharacterized protein n=1 Tax=Aspergillus arachidicola TaxID=656916 RepID=A0A5N6XS61_9EURO|nr:hypothetical protein BDV24DRAFT_120438 [Aspergillus arachidicola]